MKWNHIMDCQPEDGRMIVQIDPKWEDGHYCMGMRTYIQECAFKAVLEFCANNDWPMPDFWWVYAEDFPFPDKKEIK